MGKFAPALAGVTLLLPVPSFVSAQAAPVAPPAEKPAADKTASDIPTEATNRIVAYSAWDDDYFYLAFQVNKPNLSGRNSRAFSHPLEDDSVLIGLQTDGDRTTTKRTAKTVTIAVSAAGGTQIYTGTDSKPLYNGLEDFQARLDDVFKNEKDPTAKQTRSAALFNSLVKVGVAQKGAMRAIGTPASGYTVEMAIPWSDLGGKPQNETRMGFNLAAQSVSEGSPALQSLSARVSNLTEEDNPSLWEQIVFRNAPAPFENGLYISPRIFGGKPAIDGELSNGEWNGLTRLAFGSNAGAAGAGSLPATFTARFHPKFTPHPARPIIPIAAAKVVTPAPHQKQSVSPLVLAQYTYWYQGDPRKSSPAERVWQPDGATALAQRPLNGNGPWFSYDRADWHRQQLIEARRAGIDVILPVYRGGVRDRQRYADKGLLALATALQELRARRQDYPQVGLYLDTTSLPEIFGDKPDLREAAAQSALYAQIRDFYRMIPAPFRYGVTMNAASGGRVAYPVFLSDSAAFKAFDATFAPALRARFAADFDGADLVLIGAAGFAPDAKLDGYFGSARQEKGGAFAFDSDGWLSVATLGAGFDTTYTTATGDTPIIKPRRGGATYRDAWKAAIEKRPDWALIDGWNDFSNGANVAPSIEIGFAEDDQTKIRARQFAGTAQRNSKFLSQDIPAAMRPGGIYRVHVRAQNSGLEAWNPAAVTGAGPVPTVFAYRWRRGDQIIATGEKVGLAGQVGVSDNADAALSVAANGANGSPLPAGDYTLEIGAARDEKRALDWISGALKIPVQIGDAGADWAATLIRSDLPRMIEAGGVYPVSATIRNDGNATWRKVDGARVSLRLYRTEREQGTGNREQNHTTETPVDMADATAELSQDVAPGQETTVALQLPVMDANGTPLPLWTQEDQWIYTARWEVAPGEKSATNGQTAQNVSAQTVAVTNAAPAAVGAGVSFAPTPIAVTQYDFGVRFTSDGTPAALPGQKRLPVRLSLTNVGPQTWKSDNVHVGYHWYYQDGTEFLWEDESTPLTQFLPKGQKEVRPGQTVTDMLAWVTAPPYDGTYWLVWDLKVGDTWASTTETTRVFDGLARPVRVLGGKLTWVDLAKSYDTDGISENDETYDGDLDGTGRTLPASQTPPFADMTIAPSGMGLPLPRTGPESPRRIGFRWGPKESGAKNFITCHGQRVELGKTNGTTRILHILATSTGKDTLTDLKLVFQEPSGQSQDAYVFAVSPWDRLPTRAEEVGFVARRYHDRKGTHPGALALYHYTIKIRDPRNLSALILPDSPDIKIAAITLEK